MRTLGTTGLFVLPSTSPANAAVPYAERLRWFRALHDVARRPPSDARCARSCSTRPTASARALRERRHAARSGGRRPAAASTRARPTSDALRRELLEETGLAEFELGPLVWTRENDFAWLGELLDQRERIYLVRADAHEPAPTIDLAAEGGDRGALVDARRARGGRASGSRPRSLLPRLRELLRDGPPAEPIDVGI